METNFSSQWCFDNFIQIRSLKKAKEIRQQLIGLLERVELELSSTSDDVAIRKAVCSGFFYNAARLNKSGDCFRLAKNVNQTVYVHPSSCYFNEQLPKWVIYYELVLTSKEYMRQIVEIDPCWLTEVAPHYFRREEISEIDGTMALKKAKMIGKPPSKF